MLKEPSKRRDLSVDGVSDSDIVLEWECKFDCLEELESCEEPDSE
jgi:hypothetical protein